MSAGKSSTEASGRSRRSGDFHGLGAVVPGARVQHVPGFAGGAGLLDLSGRRFADITSGIDNEQGVREIDLSRGGVR